MREIAARGLVLFLSLAVLAASWLGYRWINRPSIEGKTVNLIARMPENGGWSQDTIRISSGETLRLRMTSEDVVHGFAVGKGVSEAVDIIPGRFSELDLVIDEPGSYTFYCTRWCGENHWRMRGVIEVSGTAGVLERSEELPLSLELGLDLDHRLPSEVFPARTPQAGLASPHLAFLPDYALEHTEVWALSPASIWQRLRVEPALASVNDGSLWDIVAWLYTGSLTQERAENARRLYRQDCLACHGENGRGDGVMVRGLEVLENHASMGSERVRPPDFGDPGVLYGASPAVLEGKIIRGGMGTGMPYFGSIYTREQIQDLTRYLYLFQMINENLDLE